MKKTSWRKLFAHTVEEADALANISVHQKRLDTLDDFSGRIIIDGEKYGIDALKLLYIEAVENVCSSAVIDFLTSLSDKQTADELINEVFLDIALSQRRKSRFISEFEKLYKLKTKPEPEYKPELKSLCQYAVEDVLFSLGIETRFNCVTKKIELSGSGSDSLLKMYSRDNILAILPSVIRDCLKSRDVKGLGQGTKAIEQYIFNIADKNRYNPVREMLISHENNDDGNLAVIYALLGVEDEFDRLLILKWLIQCVALAFNDIENPVSAEGVLVLQGPQGCGKTSFFRRMALRYAWFTEGAVVDIKNKDTLISAVSTWICELGEIDNTLKREQSALKAFITRAYDRIRFPYAAAESELVRTTSFCGTVNPDRFLNDMTGSRRYWVVHVDKIDKPFLFSMEDESVKDVWGYVYHLYKENPSGFRLSDDERERLENRNGKYDCELKYEAEVMELLDFSLPENEWQKITPAQLAVFVNGANAVHVGRALTKLSKSDERIKQSRDIKSKMYTLPLKKSITEWINNNKCR